MVRGRKRTIAGWGLVACGVVVTAVALASRWISAGGDWDQRQVISVYGGQVVLMCYGPHSDGSKINRYLNRTADPELHWTTQFQWTDSWDHVCNLGIVTVRRAPRPGPGSYLVGGVIIMLWPIALAALAGGVPLVMSGRRKNFRAREGLCPACGYNLAGLAAGAACPECGKGKVPLAP